MELKLLPCTINLYPNQALLVKGDSPLQWLSRFKETDTDLTAVRVFPIPSVEANVLYGCVAIFDKPVNVQNPGRAGFYQLVNNKLLIPENTRIDPQLCPEEWDRLFGSHYYIFHPETGLSELQEEINWMKLISPPTERKATVTAPLKGVAIPKKITSISVHADEQDLLDSVEEAFGDNETDKLPFDMQKVMKGNQKEIDKLLNFLEKNPEMALKYAVPLDVIGSSRGIANGRFVFGKGISGSAIGGLASDALSLLKYISFIILAFAAVALVAYFFTGRNGSFRAGSIIFAFLIFRLLRYIFNNDSSSGGNSGNGRTALIDDDKFYTLKQKYVKLADEYVKQKEYKKAAHIHLKLLKNNLKAAEILEEGGYYAEAAPIYLKRCQNKIKAASCYEKGKVYHEALVLYREMDNYEKAGDMCLLLNKKEEADKHFGILIDLYRENSQYVKASFIYKNKVKNPALAAGMLLEGWNADKDAYNCLNNYFANMQEPDEVMTGIEALYKTLPHKKKETFLNVIQHEFKKHDSLKPAIKDIAYEIIASEIKRKPALASELIFFNKEDKKLVKDVTKYKALIREGKL